METSLVNQRRSKLAFFSSLIFATPLLAANDPQTYAEKSLQQKNEMIAPQRLTVGPTDNFQSAITPDETTLFYTANSNLAVRIFVQDVATGFSKSLIDEKFDSKDPSLSPDAHQLAFTNFEKDSRGDICVLDLKDRKRQCLTNRETEDQNPFWISNDELAFLSRKTSDDPWTLVTTSLREPANPRAILYTGDIASPHASAPIQGISYLVFTRMKQGRSVMELRKILRSQSQLALSEPTEFSIDLPGLSSFPRFDTSGEFLYFGQYTSDTNEDLQVDGHDKSAIFRIKIADVLSGSQFFPEPITSIDQNCNYPVVNAAHVYMTCASVNLTSDAALDIYRLPLTGMIPDHWEQDKLLRASETARSYSDRILVSEALMSRIRRYRNSETYERLLHNYILDGQLPAAIFYADRLSATAKDDPQFYKILSIVLRTELRAKQEGTAIESAPFRGFLDQQMKAVELISTSEPLWKQAAIARIRSFSKSPAPMSFDPRKIRRPLVLYYASQMELEHEKTRLDALKRLSFASILNEDSQVFYAYEFLREVDRQFPEDQRLSFLKSQAPKFPAHHPLSVLTDLTLHLHDIQNDDIENVQNQKAYASILKNLTQLEPRYFLYRAAIVRTLLTLSARGFWTYMTFFSTRWMNAASTEDLEYAHARRQFLSISLENGYGQFTSGHESFAGDRFANTARLTDDLEAHYGFIFSRLKLNRRKDVDDVYKDLTEHHFIHENIVYVRAILALFTSSGELDAKEMKSLRAELEAMPNKGFNQALRFELMGYLSHHIYLKARETGEDDSADFQKAHRYYMLALDLANENERITSTLLFNLGLLHQVAGNHGQSLAFFDFRKNQIFEDERERAAFAWYYAKSFFHNYQPARALEVVENFLNRPVQVQKFPELLDKAAFYAAQAKNYDRAVTYYEKFFKSDPPLSPRENLQVKTGYGYALFKAKKIQLAKKTFSEIVRSNLVTEPIHAIALPADHYRLIALGFLAQLEDQPTARLKWLSERLTLFEKQSDHLAELFLRREDWLKDMLAVENQIAEIHLHAGNAQEASTALNRSVHLLSEFAKESGNALNQNLVLGLSNYFEVVHLAKQTNPQFSSSEFIRALEIADQTHKALDQAAELKRVPEYASFEKTFLSAKK
jgi:hypothetical protein